MQCVPNTTVAVRTNMQEELKTCCRPKIPFKPLFWAKQTRDENDKWSSRLFLHPRSHLERAEVTTISGNPPTRLSFGGHANSSRVSPVVSSLFFVSADMSLTRRGSRTGEGKRTVVDGNTSRGSWVCLVQAQALIWSNWEPWPGQLLIPAVSICKTVSFINLQVFTDYVQ